jgi:hypothetical protein
MERVVHIAGVARAKANTRSARSLYCVGKEKVRTRPPHRYRWSSTPPSHTRTSTAPWRCSRRTASRRSAGSWGSSWLYLVVLEELELAVQDVRAVLTLEPNYVRT